jgi:hypothetical protein
MAISTKIGDAMREIGILNEKREAHEIKCAKINERTAAAQERTAEILERQSRDLESLKAQMAHVASGAAGRAREIGRER